jgi:hypothetical protein
MSWAYRAKAALTTYASDLNNVSLFGKMLRVGVSRSPTNISWEKRWDTLAVLAEYGYSASLRLLGLDGT